MPMEQFIRQSMSIESKPVIVFSVSDTPNWSIDACKEAKAQPPQNPEEKTLLADYDAKNVKKMATAGKPQITGQFSSVMGAFKSYKMSGNLFDTSTLCIFCIMNIFQVE